MLLSLPDELLPCLAIHLDIPDVLTLSHTCKRLYKALNSHYFKRLYHRKIANAVAFSLVHRPPRLTLARDGPLRGLALPSIIATGGYIYSSHAALNYERSQAVLRTLRAHDLSTRFNRRPRPESLQGSGIIWSTSELRVSRSLVGTMRQLQHAMKCDGFKARWHSFHQTRDREKRWLTADAESARTREFFCAGLVRRGKIFWESVGKAHPQKQKHLQQSLPTNKPLRL